MFIESAFSNPYFFFSWVLIIVFSICVHEYAHAQMALWKGDDTAALLGHLSLNPLVQMGWMSLLLLALVGIAWGSVPVNPRQLRGRSAHAQVAFAGPVANLILCVLCALAGGLVEVAGVGESIVGFLMMASMANAVLFLFNMLPIPMFDGWTVLALWVPADGAHRCPFGIQLFMDGADRYLVHRHHGRHLGHRRRDEFDDSGCRADRR
jgi:Zn-dependent protease